MPRGDKSKYTSKQKRKAEHIEDSYEERGVGKKEAERRAWATVNKQEGGGKKAGGSGRKSSGRRGKATGRSKSSTKSNPGSSRKSRKTTRSRSGSKR